MSVVAREPSNTGEQQHGSQNILHDQPSDCWVSALSSSILDAAAAISASALPMVAVSSSRFQLNIHEVLGYDATLASSADCV